MKVSDILDCYQEHCDSENSYQSKLA
jgi:hypothetical protein